MHFGIAWAHGPAIVGGGRRGRVCLCLNFCFLGFFFFVFGCCLSFCFLEVLGILFYFIMAFFLRLPYVWNISCVDCFDFNTLYGFSKHVKSAHLLASFISKASRANLFFASSPHQFGVLTLGGYEAIHFGIRTFFDLHLNWAMMQVDIENVFVVTLVLSLQPKQRGYKVVGQEEA